MDPMKAQNQRRFPRLGTLAAILLFLFSLRDGLPSPRPPAPAAGPDSDTPAFVSRVDARRELGRKKKKFPWLLLGAGVLVTGGAVFLLKDYLFAPGPNLDFLPLEFPFQNWHQVTRMAAFGIPNWSGSEPHNGIDLIVTSPAVIVSPTAGTVSRIDSRENSYSHPAGQLILSVDIYINRQRTVSLCFEPGTTNAALKAQQSASIAVKKGDRVQAGTVIGTLLAGEQGYTHLHYMLQDKTGDNTLCPYLYSSAAARTIFDTLKTTRPDNHLPDGRICFGQ
jgi:hypothetical protein